MRQDVTIGVVGAGTMGSGIAQLAAQHGHRVVLIDSQDAALQRARDAIEKQLLRAEGRGKLSAGSSSEILARISCQPLVGSSSAIGDAALIVEAIIEDIEVKRSLFRAIEEQVSDTTIIATNTSSLSVTALSSTLRHPQRFLGLHFFNPAPLMPLVEVVPTLRSDPQHLVTCRALMERWGKVPVVATDSPGFIVNRVARPYYGESLRILEEGIASTATIDWALTQYGGFRMGPFELMDLIGNDVNYAVTESVFAAFSFDPRYRPSLVQRRMVEAGLLGRKSGRGYYDYRDGATKPEPHRDDALAVRILERVRAMLINEAVDALLLGVATAADLDLAMTKGVNYPRGLLEWGAELGWERVLQQLEQLQQEYGDDRYRPSSLLRRLARGECSISEFQHARLHT